MLDPVIASQVVRSEWSRMVSVAMRILSDLDESEDVAQEALLEATRTWPTSGIPANPGAWLTTVSKNRALNRLRDTNRRGGTPLSFEETHPSPSTPATEPDLDGYGDDRLRLIVLCCHPSLGRDAQVSLTLRLVAGLTVREIASAFVTSEATIGQRISRAKARLRQQHARFELPNVAELQGRLESVLEVIYLIFNEGYGPHSEHERRRILCAEAIAVGSQLTEIAPSFPDSWGLLALAHFQASRFDARLTPCGDIVPLDEQDRQLWDRGAIASAERALASANNAAGEGRPVGRYTLEAEIAAQHARATHWPDTAWETIESLYAALVELTANPIASLNWAIARSYTRGPASSLALLDTISDDLAGYQLLTATRADLLRRSDRHAEAAALYQQLVADTPSTTQQAFYQRRLDECQHRDRQPPADP